MTRGGYAVLNRLSAQPSSLLAGGAAAVLVALAGAVGFRLEPDIYRYSSGEAIPNAVLVSGLGAVGGMWLIVAVAALATGALFALLPSWRSRLLFVALGGFWFLFPAADALGVLAVAVMARRRLRGFWWLLTGAAHAVAGVCTISMLRRWRWPWLWAGLSAAVVGFVFVVWPSEPSGGVAAWEHGLYMSRYLLPAAYLFAARVER